MDQTFVVVVVYTAAVVIATVTLLSYMRLYKYSLELNSS
jgi:hypothetical protein